MAKIKPTPSGGKPNMAPVASTTTNEALGTPAMPLLVTKNTSNIITCCQTSPVIDVILKACAINILAKVMYIILPSKLKE